MLLPQQNCGSKHFFLFFPPSDARITALALGFPLPDTQPIKLLQAAEGCFSHSHRQSIFCTEHPRQPPKETEDHVIAEMPRSSSEHGLQRRHEQGGGSTTGECITN